MGHFLASLAGVPLGDVLVNDVQAVNISGSDCLTASIRVTRVDGMCCVWAGEGRECIYLYRDQKLVCYEVVKCSLSVLAR